MHNIRLLLTYDGTRYLGWQKTKTGLSIEKELEKALLTILQQKIVLQAASRTDAGVHALGQVVNFFTAKNIDIGKLQYSLNCLLPKDIVVNRVEIADPNFHPTIDCKSKTYHYHVCYERIQLPCQRSYAWHYPRPISIDQIKKGITLLVGQRDFSSFCNSKASCNYLDYRRDLETIEVYELPNECLRFEIRGNNFLYKMVRNLVGSLIYIGTGKIPLQELEEIIEKGERTHGGVTAPACGLFLYQVDY